MSSGAAFPHEMMHILAITEDRPHIVDNMFDGTAGRRIYGPTDVAKAARIATQSNDFTLQAYNADTYAVFAQGTIDTLFHMAFFCSSNTTLRANVSFSSQAFFWNVELGALIPPRASEFFVPDGAVEVNSSFDSEDNYVAYTLPSEVVSPDTNNDAPTTGLTFPTPSCLPAAEGGIIQSSAMTALGDFCTTQTATVSAGAQPISETYDGGEGHTIRLTMSWYAAAGDCPQSQSPNQNAGRDCNTIFRNILSGCKYDSSSVILTSLGAPVDRLSLMKQVQRITPPNRMGVVSRGSADITTWALILALQILHRRQLHLPSRI